MLTAPALTKAGFALGRSCPFVEADAGMRHEDLRVFLEVGGDRDGRDVVLHRQEIADHVAAHEELDLAGDQEHAAVRRRAALEDGDVQAVFGVSPVDESLVIAAGLRIGDPIGAEGHLVEGEGRSGEPDRPRQRRHDRNAHTNPSRQFIGGRRLRRLRYAVSFTRTAARMVVLARRSHHKGRNSKRRIHFSTGFPRID